MPGQRSTTVYGGRFPWKIGSLKGSTTSTQPRLSRRRLLGVAARADVWELDFTQIPRWIHYVYYGSRIVAEAHYRAYSVDA